MPPDPEPGRRPGAVLVAAGVVAAEGAALVAFGGWLLASSTDDTPSNQRVFTGSTAFAMLLGILVLVVAVALWLRKGWAYGAGVFLQLLALGVTYTMAREGFWPGAGLLGLGAIGGLLALFSTPARAALGRC